MGIPEYLIIYEPCGMPPKKTPQYLLINVEHYLIIVPVIAQIFP